MKKTLWAALGLATGLAVTACASVPPVRTGYSNLPRAEVTRQGQTLALRYELDRDAGVWAFMDSALEVEDRQPWRPRQWRILTPNVVLDRAGHYDVLRTVDGRPVPRIVDIEVRPKGVDLEAQYPTLTFSNGAVALPTRQLSIVPFVDMAEVRALPSDLNQVSLPVPQTEVRWRDLSGPVLFEGQRFPTLITQLEQSYVLMGEADVTRSEGLTAVIDPALPQWLAGTLSEAAPSMGRWYLQRLGPAKAGADKPVLMAAWRGATERMTSMGGSVLPGLIVVNFEGRGIIEPTPEVRQRALWFVAHEAAHFWLGQTVRYAYARDAWITEGGADLMAVRALKARDPAYDDRTELQNEVDDCVKHAGQSIAGAGDRGEHRAYYACGAVFAMAAEAAQKRATGGDYLDFVRETLSRSRDGTVDAAGWMAQFTQTGGRPETADLMTQLIDRGSDNPARDLALILSDVGVRREGARVILR